MGHKKNVPCRFYMKGQCKKGRLGLYTHVDNSNDQNRGKGINTVKNSVNTTKIAPTSQIVVIHIMKFANFRKTVTIMENVDLFTGDFLGKNQTRSRPF